MNEEKKENDGKNYFLGVLISLLTGMFIGTAIGILFAPKAGKETRKDIREKSEELVEKSKKGVDSVVGQTKEFVEKSKSKFTEMKERGEEVWEKGKDKVEKVAKVIIPKIEKTREKVEEAVKKGKEKAKKTEGSLS